MFFKVLFKIILWIIFIVAALLATWFLCNGGYEIFKFSIEAQGFWEFIKTFFKTLFGGSAI